MTSPVTSRMTSHTSIMWPTETRILLIDTLTLCDKNCLSLSLYLSRSLAINLFLRLSLLFFLQTQIIIHLSLTHFISFHSPVSLSLSLSLSLIVFAWLQQHLKLLLLIIAIPLLLMTMSWNVPTRKKIENKKSIKNRSQLRKFDWHKQLQCCRRCCRLKFFSKPLSSK